jgi:glycosyltransferase involved in cell wall biosynthesis
LIEGASRRPRVAVWAYACNPDRGSDSGGTWAYVRALARHADLVVLNREQDADSLQAWKAANPGEALEFVTVSEVGWTTVLQRGFRFHRQLEFVNYLAWLRNALAVTREIHDVATLDAVNHASFGNYWLPSPLRKLDLPTIWGPVGGGVRTPLRLWPSLGAMGVIAEIERSIFISLASWLPSTRRTQARAGAIIVEAEETRDRLLRRRRADAVIVNRAAIIDPATVNPAPAPVSDHGPSSPTEFVFPSALWGKKGPRLALAALAHADPRARLSFVNDGYERPRLEKLARRWGVADRVSFRGRIPRDELFTTMQGAAGLMFTGLREEGGLALTEAMLLGLPVIVLARGGAKLIASQSLDPCRVKLVRAGTSKETARLLGRAMTELLEAAPRERTPTLDVAPHQAGIRAALAAALGGQTEAMSGVDR